jgi:hypothetical protein
MKESLAHVAKAANDSGSDEARLLFYLKLIRSRAPTYLTIAGPTEWWGV